MDTVGIGIVGSGFMGLTYAEAVSKHVRGAHLAGVAGGRRAETLAAEYGVPMAPTLEALLAQDGVQGVVLATPDQSHCEQTLLAAAAGVHVLVEKPMAPNVNQCDQMIAACQASDVNLAVVKTERYRKLTLRAKQLLDEGSIGPLWMMRTISCFSIDATRGIVNDRKWLVEPTSGGMFMNIAAHNADFLLWLADRPVERVFAQVQTYSDLPAKAQSVMAQLVFAGGVMGHMWISSEFPPPSLPSSEVRFQVIGAKGMLDFENFEYLDVGQGDKWERVYTPERFDYLKEPKSPIRLVPHIGVLQEFVDSIREQRPPRVGGAQGRAAIEICEACLTSARTGEAVKLGGAA